MPDTIPMTRFLTLDFAWDNGGDEPLGVWQGTFCLECAVWHTRPEDVLSGEADSDSLGGYHMASEVMEWSGRVAVITEDNNILHGAEALRFVAQRAALCR